MPSKKIILLLSQLAFLAFFPQMGITQNVDHKQDNPKGLSDERVKNDLINSGLEIVWVEPIEIAENA